MSTLNESISRVRELLANPREQNPTVRQVFGSILREFQNFYNTLSNSSQPITTKEVTLNVDSSNTDYLINQDLGKILFVTANDGATAYYAPVEFTDLQDASTEWWNYYPLAAARPEDYNYTAFSTKIAFYRKNGSLYARIPAYFYNNTLTITAATGNWIENVSTGDSAVLKNYHHLVEIRAAMNLLSSARWSEDLNTDIQMADRLMGNLQIQERRVWDDFVIAKRSLVASDVVYIETADSYL